MNLEVRSTATSAVETDALVVFVTDQNTSKEKDAKPDLVVLTTDGSIREAAARVLASGEFGGKTNETLLLHEPRGVKAARLLLIGLGKEPILAAQETRARDGAPRASVDVLRRAAGAAVRFAKGRGLSSLGITAPGKFGTDEARAIAEGAIVADFDSDTYRTDRKNTAMDSLTILVAEPEKSAAEAAARDGRIVAEAQNFARAMINEPSNRMTPTILGQKAAEMAKEFGLQCDVYGADKLRELKMGAFLGVTQGSDEPPALIVMRYEPEGAPAEPVIGLVGKGITFDSGGLSLKPADSMEKMKYDMAGGASMIAAMRAIAQLKPKVKVIGVVCATENMVSGKAQKPGDVQIAMSGKSIEVLNTDAEGRLVLADGLFYARQLGATHLIDAATLTGAVAIALGQVNAGVFSNDEAAYEQFAKGIEKSGEKFWRLPLEDEYRDQIQSAIADIRNTGLTRYGGATNAAMFLREFVGETPWVHLDIAGMAWLDADKAWIAKGPSGIGVRSIVEWVRRYGS